MRFAFLGSSTSWYLRDLQRAAAGKHEIEAVAFEQLESLVTSRRCQVGSRDTDLRDYDAIIVRSMPPGSLEQVVFRMNALALLAASGMAIVNPPRALEIAIDKYLALTRLRSLGLPVPETVCCQTTEAAMGAFHSLGQDVVVKPIFGGEGRGIMRVSDEALASRTFRTLEQLRAVIYVQRFHASDDGDIRLMVIGEEVWGMRRLAQGDWRTNISQGGIAKRYTVPEEHRTIALRVSADVGAPICAVDLLPATDHTTYALEVNAVPGWRALRRILDVDIAAKVLRLVETAATTGPSPRETSGVR